MVILKTITIVLKMNCTHEVYTIRDLETLVALFNDVHRPMAYIEIKDSEITYNKNN